jgi:hypothetical protein
MNDFILIDDICRMLRVPKSWIYRNRRFLSPAQLRFQGKAFKPARFDKAKLEALITGNNSSVIIEEKKRDVRPQVPRPEDLWL